MALEGLNTASPAPSSGSSNAGGASSATGTAGSAARSSATGNAGSASRTSAAGNASSDSTASAGGSAATGGTGSSNGASGATGANSASGANASGTTDANTGGSDFNKILNGTLAAGSTSGVTSAAQATAASDKPAEAKSDDDAVDGEISFEDLSEFIAQVLVPGQNAQPEAAASDPDAIEIDFMGGDEIMSALSADTRAKATAPSTAAAAAQDRFADAIASTANAALSADSSLLKDALAAGKTATTTLDPNAVAPAADGSVNGLPSPTAASPLHAAALHSHSTAQAPLQAEIRSPMGTQAWADEMGGHLTWMAAHGRESGSLTLTPEHLGPIEVRISVQDGQASVWFGAQNADTRSAIEQALPRLRELFSSQGLSLADSGVFREAPRQSAQSFSGAANGAAGADEISGVTAVAKRGNGMLDLYA